MDFLFGLLIYASMALVLGRTFNLVDLALVLFFATAPDLDFIPFALLRRKLKLVSHWIIHFPLLYIPLGMMLVGMVMRGWFYVAAFSLASFAHFLHDAHSAPGIQWFWPVSKRAYALDHFRFVLVEEVERRQFYNRMRENASGRTLLDEVWIRIGKGRPKWMGRSRS